MLMSFALAHNLYHNVGLSGKNQCNAYCIAIDITQRLVYIRATLGSARIFLVLSCS